TVGASVARVLQEKAAELTRQCGRDIVVTAVSARDPKRDRGVDVSTAKWFDDAVELAEKADIDVFVELIGGDGPTTVEGPFAQNRLFIRMLAAATGRPVIASETSTGTSIGAALLAS
ncbi:homoserine dehydrogenase, partial [Mesorhizobium sp. M3A.F.Ca.ET.201.01.1.1]